MRIATIGLAMAAMTCAAGAQTLDTKGLGPALTNALGMGVQACIADERCRDLATRSTVGAVNRAIESCSQRGPECQDAVLKGMAFLSDAYGRR